MGRSYGYWLLDPLNPSTVRHLCIYTCTYTTSDADQKKKERKGRPNIYSPHFLPYYPISSKKKLFLRLNSSRHVIRGGGGGASIDLQSIQD